MNHSVARPQRFKNNYFSWYRISLLSSLLLEHRTTTSLSVIPQRRLYYSYPNQLYNSYYHSSSSFTPTTIKLAFTAGSKESCSILYSTINGTTYRNQQRYSSKHHHLRRQQVRTLATKSSISNSEPEPTSTSTPTPTTTAAAMTKSEDPIVGNAVDVRQQQVAAIRSRFQNVFESDTEAEQKRQEQLKVWESLWQENITPWDLGKPTPALVSELQSSYNKLPQPLTSDNNFDGILRVFVPGCGSGYDLVTLAYHVDELIQNNVLSSSSSTKYTSAVVVGLDLAEAPLNRAATVIDTLLQEKEQQLQSTSIQLVKGDFFVPTSGVVVKTLGGNSNSTPTPVQYGPNIYYDLIFDYTFFCALPPNLRTPWGQRTSELLQPSNGRLVTFMFPLIDVPSNSDAPLPGPPFPVSVESYRTVLEPLGVRIDEPDNPRKNNDSVPSRIDMELTCWWTKKN